MSVAETAMRIVKNMALTLKGCVKMAVASRRVKYAECPDSGRTLVIMGNGPSLSRSLHDFPEAFGANPLMAVNFAANTDEFLVLRPRYYMLADPVFFNRGGNENVDKLWRTVSEKVDWPMTMFVPYANIGNVSVGNANVVVSPFNFVGVEGFDAFCVRAYRSRLAMPRPRNVLIPSIMVGLWLGYRNIYITGADHSWTKTLDVNERNEVVSLQPHFYKDNDSERRRVASVYKNIRLHELLLSFHIAFKAYFGVARYADAVGAHVYNATPGSFIDAFERRSLGELDNRQNPA